MPLKDVIHEKFGDGIMSAIDFTMNVDKEEDPEHGDRGQGHDVREVPSIQEVVEKEVVALTEGELFQRAVDLVPVLKERAGLTEELRRVPDETVSDVLATMLQLIGVPEKFGGLNVNYGLALDVAAELGRGCPSTSWCYGLWAAHAWLVGYWPLQAQQEVSARAPTPYCQAR